MNQVTKLTMTIDEHFTSMHNFHKHCIHVLSQNDLSRLPDSFFYFNYYFFGTLRNSIRLYTVAIRLNCIMHASMLTFISMLLFVHVHACMHVCTIYNHLNWKWVILCTRFTCVATNWFFVLFNGFILNQSRCSCSLTFHPWPFFTFTCHHLSYK